MYIFWNHPSQSNFPKMALMLSKETAQRPPRPHENAKSLDVVLVEYGPKPSQPHPVPTNSQGTVLSVFRRVRVGYKSVTGV